MVQEFFLVHVGAGSHAHKRSAKYRALIGEVLKQKTWQKGCKILEGSPLTNTGYGSCLNFKGQVMCDASFIEKEDHLKSQQIGMYNVTTKFPILDAYNLSGCLRTMYSKSYNHHYLTKPSLIDYNAVIDSVPFLQQKDDSPPSHLITKQHKAFYDEYSDSLFIDRSGASENIVDVLDTVGLLHYVQGHTLVATSSGGNFFKLPGRIGCAGIPGCAIYHEEREGYDISCLCSGNGEDIITMQLSSFIVQHLDLKSYYLYPQNIVDLIKKHADKFELQAVNDEGNPVIYVGVVVCLRDLSTNEVHVIYCHTTPSFYFGFGTPSESEIVLSRLPSSSNIGKSFACGEFKI